jgi:hypothetical protein
MRAGCSSAVFSNHGKRKREIEMKLKLVKATRPGATDHSTLEATFELDGPGVEVSEREYDRLTKTFPGCFKVVKEETTAGVPVVKKG